MGICACITPNCAQTGAQQVEKQQDIVWMMKASAIRRSAML